MAKDKKFSVSEGLFSNSPGSEIEAPASTSNQNTFQNKNTSYNNKKGKVGRPTSATEPINPISFRITPKQHTAIKMYAITNGMDQSEALRKIIDESAMLKDILQNL